MVEPTTPEISGQDRTEVVLERVALVRQLLERRTERAALLRLRHNAAWITLGGQMHIALATESAVAGVLVTQSEVVVLAPVNEAARLRDEELEGLPLEVVPLPWEDAGALDREARRRAGGPITSDADLELDLLPRRSILHPIEHARLAWLGDRAETALRVALDGVAPGRTEFELVSDLDQELLRQGIRVPVALAAADERIAAYRHPLPTLHPIRRRVMLIVVGERWGLHAAGTQFRNLEPLDADTARRMEQSNAVLRAMEEASQPGGTFGDVFAVAQERYAKFGFPDEWQLHHQGGSIGYRPREYVAIPGDQARIEAGMAFAWNPSITGAKAESTIALAPADGSIVRIVN